MARIFTISLAVLVILFCLISCSGSTSSKVGKVTGNITLDGQSDFSGISVSIYSAGVVPEKVTGINNDYPQVAFQVTDQVCFDHRSYTPLATTTTNQEGFFEFGELPYNEYIIAYSKEGWGYNYVFGIVLNQAEQNITTKSDMKLYPEQVIPSFISGAYTFETGKCYVANSNVVFGEAAQIDMQSNARILLGQNVKISSHGALTLPAAETWAHITSLTGIYNGYVSPTQLAEGLSILEGTNSVHNISFSYLSNALKIETSDVEVSNTSYRSCVFGLTANSTQDLSIAKSLFISNKDEDGCASYFYNVTRISNNKCIYYDNYMAQKNEIVKEASVENNVFIDNNRGYANLWESTGVFQYNLIAGGEVGVENSGMSNLEIYYNSITASACVQTYHSNNWYNTVNYGWTKANNNNFLPAIYAMESRAAYYYPDGPYPLDFRDNFWNTTNAGTIDAYIIDFNDLGLVVGSGVSAIVDYVPFKQVSIPNAGIQAR